MAAGPWRLLRAWQCLRRRLSDEAVDIALGFRHSCAKLSSGGMECWGYAATNALGRWAGGDDLCAGSQSKSVGAVMGLHEATIRSLSAGMDTTCALMTDGELYCWGWNEEGQSNFDLDNDGFDILQDCDDTDPQVGHCE